MAVTPIVQYKPLSTQSISYVPAASDEPGFDPLYFTVVPLGTVIEKVDDAAHLKLNITIFTTPERGELTAGKLIATLVNALLSLKELVYL